jgi:predicted HicB family RNase H-like nuclease
MNMMKYRGYTATVEYDPDDRLFFGDVIDIADTIVFQGDTVDVLEASFRKSVDGYLEYCAKKGMEPARPYSGKFVLRLPPPLHKRLTAAARRDNTSMNQWTVEAIQMRIEASESKLVNPAAAEREAQEATEEMEDAAGG